MKMGHTTGTKTEKAGSQDWYAVIAEQRIAELEANIRAAEMAEAAMVAALAKQVGNAVTAMPEAAARITKAAAVVQAGDVYPLTSGSYLVGSQNTQAAYLVRRAPWGCDCPDHTHRGTTCKHILAAMLTVKLGTQYTPSYN